MLDISKFLLTIFLSNLNVVNIFMKLNNFFFISDINVPNIYFNILSIKINKNNRYLIFKN